MKRKLYPLLILFVLLTYGCIEEYTANVGSEGAGTLVIEGNIISDSTVVFSLSLTRPLVSGNSNTSQYFDVEADVSVIGSDGSNWQATPFGDGQYQVQIGTLSAANTYSLQVIYDGDTYTSEPQYPLASSAIGELEFTQDSLGGNVDILVTSAESDLSTPKYYQWTYTEDWEVRADYHTQWYYDEENDSIITYPYPLYAQGWLSDKLRTILIASTETLNEHYIYRKQVHTIPEHSNRLSCLYSIMVAQRNLSKGEHQYYKEMVTINNEMGGLFTPQPSELPGNIECSNSARRAIGYVGCNLNVSYKRLYIDKTEITYVPNPKKCDFGNEKSFREYWEEGFQIAHYDELLMQYYWAREYCVDVRESRANPDGRPDWWPNPYLYKTE